MFIGLDLDKTLLLSTLPYEFIDANERTLEYDCSYGHLLYNEKRIVNEELVRKVILGSQKYLSEHKEEEIEIVILTGSWTRNIPKTYSKFLSSLFPKFQVTLLSNPCKYINEESIALFKANEIIQCDIQIYIDDDNSISEKIHKVLEYNGVKTKRVQWNCTETSILHTTYIDDVDVKKMVDLMGVG